MKSRKKQKEPETNVLTNISDFIKKAAFKFDLQPYQVTSAQFWTVALGKINEWEIRKLGGFGNIRDVLFPYTTAEEEEVKSRGKEKVKKIKFPKIENFLVHGETMEEIFKQCKLKPTDVLKIIVQPDTHVDANKSHDEVALRSACKFIKYIKPHGIINLGDFLEMEPVSHWDPKSAQPRRLVPDLKMGKLVLAQIDEAAGRQCVYKRFLIGNHEFWLEDYLVQRIPETLDGLEDLGPNLDLQTLLGLADFGYKTIPFNNILKIGGCHFIHGYYTSTHHAKKHLDIFGVNLYYGHLHDMQSHSAVSVKGLHEAASLGCLRTLDAKFLKGRPNNWSHSISLFEFRYDGSYTRYSPIIINGKMSFNGQIFDGNV